MAHCQSLIVRFCYQPIEGRGFGILNVCINLERREGRKEDGKRGGMEGEKRRKGGKERMEG